MSQTPKRRILEAAARTVLQQGVSGLTMEAVAEAAGLSKGGLLYHYRSKEALIRAMVERLADVTDERIDAYRHDDSDAGGWTRGYIATCAADAMAEDDPGGRLAAAILAGGATDPELLDTFRERQQDWRAALRGDGIDPVTAHVVRLAADGLWLNQVFDVPVLSDEERQAVIERLEALTRA